MNKRQVIIIDDVPPEATAMLQAMYSRDPQSVTEHLKKVKEVGPEKFMASFYVGYGHKSIGDCGTTSIFIEQVSLLVSKAIQEWPLYNGQEASTRYLNFNTQEVLNPVGSAAGKTVQDGWMKLYNQVLEALIPAIEAQFPRVAEQSEIAYKKAVKAKAFDIARGFLPAGATTLLSWNTNFRQAYDHIQLLHHHPLQEVREVTAMIHEGLKKRYPSSFSQKLYPEQESWIAKAQGQIAYSDRPDAVGFHSVSKLDLDGLMEFKDLLETRPAKTELPQELRKFGNIHFKFPLDFGSFRDLQRQRSGSRRMPLLTLDHGFTPWYLEQIAGLPDGFAAQVASLIKDQEALIKKLDCSPKVRQYYIAMGYAVACDETFSLPAAVYVAELRCGQTVHPTLRIVAQKMADTIKKAVPGIALHCDMSPDEWSIKRGTQDIVKK